MCITVSLEEEKEALEDMDSQSTSLVWYDGVSAVDSPFDIKCKARRSKIKELQSTVKLHMQQLMQPLMLPTEVVTRHVHAFWSQLLWSWIVVLVMSGIWTTQRLAGNRENLLCFCSLKMMRTMFMVTNVVYCSR